MKNHLKNLVAVITEKRKSKKTNFKYNFMKLLKKSKIFYFVLFTTVLIFSSCQESESISNDQENIELEGNLVFLMGDTQTAYNAGQNYFTHLDSEQEQKEILFSNTRKIATISQNNRSSGENLLIEFDDSDSTVSLNNITQLSNNSVSLDVVYSDNGNVYDSSIVLDSDITVNQFMSNLVGVHDLGDNAAIVSGRCPWCIVAVIVIISDTCMNAQGACTPCNGSLTVGACSCSCNPTTTD